MKSIVSLGVVVSLIGATLPVAAQRNEPTRGPLARAIAREAARLAAEPASAAAVPQVNALPNSDWSRVRRLKPGTEIVVTVRGAMPATRHVAMTDNTGVELLSLATLPDEAARALLGLVKDYPLFLRDARRGGVQTGNVRMGPAGVLIDGQKVAELGQILERVERTDVAEIRIDRNQGWSDRKKRAVGVGAGLAGLGVMLIAVGFQRSNEAQRLYEQCLPIAGYHCGGPGEAGFNQKFGGTVLLVTGALAITAAAASTQQGTVYRAP